MYITMVLVVLCTAIVVLFSQEFAGLFKKIFAIPGVKLLLPLAFASWVIETYENWGLWLLLWCKDGLHTLMHRLDVYLPTHVSSLSLAHIIHLFLLASLPACLLLALAKGRGRYEPWPCTYQVGAAIWIVAAVLLTVHRP